MGLACAFLLSIPIDNFEQMGKSDAVPVQCCLPSCPSAKSGGRRCKSFGTDLSRVNWQTVQLFDAVKSMQVISSPDCNHERIRLCSVQQPSSIDQTVSQEHSKAD